MKVQISFGEHSSSPKTFHNVFASMWGDMKIKLEKITKKDLVMDVEMNGGKTHREDVLERIHEILRVSNFVFYCSNIRIGNPMKCHTCNGTGKSYYPSDILAKEM